MKNGLIIEKKEYKNKGILRNPFKGDILTIIIITPSVNIHGNSLGGGGSEVGYQKKLQW